ncbi:MAG TPA: PQQ-binding-like beta-propeller repeat protein, partial [Negativicutes bacterium]
MFKYLAYWRTLLLFLVFFSTIGLLGKHIFFSGAEYAATVVDKAGQEGQRYQQRASISLGEVEVHNYQRMGFTRGQVRFSPDGSTLAVGTENGTILVLNNQGQIIWRREMGLGKITALEFSGDGKVIFVGETSVEGNLYCLDASSGKERWRQSSAIDLGVDIKAKIYPGIVRIVSDANGCVYAVSQKYGKTSDGGNEYQGQIYSFASNGALRWRFPADGKLDAWVNWISVDQEGHSLVFGTANFDTDQTYDYSDNIYLLQGESGAKSWSTAIDPTPPYNRTVMRGSPNLSKDGQYLAAMASDGRAFLYDAKGQQLWQRVLSAPKKIGGVYLNAVGRDAYVVGNNIVFATI